ncbi:MAG: YdbH domain-containing protein [Enterobacterales bacterium]|nr:YdbH domain-containing protein [Enterobacterales bacterium]
MSHGQLNLSKMSGEYQGQDLSGKMQLIWQEVNFALNKGSIDLIQQFNQKTAQVFGLDLVDAHISTRLGQDRWQGELHLKLDEQPLPASFVYHIKAQTLELTLQSQSISNSFVNRMASRYISNKTWQPKLIEGRIEHQAHIAIALKPGSKPIQFNSKLSLQGGIVEFAKHRFKGIDLKQQIPQLQPIEATSELSIKQIELASGLLFSDFTAALSVYQKQQLMIVKELQTNLLSGLLEAKMIQIKHNRLLPTEVKISHIELQQLFDFIDIDGLSISGKADLNLPLESVNGELVITEGEFHSTQQGIVRYQILSQAAEDSAEPSNGSNIAIQALENFHYQKISGTIDYNEKGEYRIALHLLGKNPDLYDGYPIDFNLVLNGQLSGVFKSLFLTGDFEQAILQQVDSAQKDPD